MNTAIKTRPIIPLEGFKNYEIVLEDLEFLFSKKQLEAITNLHNHGFWAVKIAEIVKRDEYEVLMAIVHQHRKGKITRELAFRGK